MKVSILLLYKRIFPQKWFRSALLAVGAFVVSYSTVQFFADIFQCTPVSFLWDKTIPGGPLHPLRRPGHRWRRCYHCYRRDNTDHAHTLGLETTNAYAEKVVALRHVPHGWLVSTRLEFKVHTNLCSACIASIVRLCYASKVGSFDASCEC